MFPVLAESDYGQDSFSFIRGRLVCFLVKLWRVALLRFVEVLTADSFLALGKWVSVTISSCWSPSMPEYARVDDVARAGSLCLWSGRFGFSRVGHLGDFPLSSWLFLFPAYVASLWGWRVLYDDFYLLQSTSRRIGTVPPFDAYTV